MKEIIFVDSLFNISVLSIQNIKIGCPDTQQYFCDVTIRTINFIAKFEQMDIFEFDFINIRNSLKKFLTTNKPLLFEFNTRESEFSIKVQNDNTVSEDSLNITIIANDVYYGKLEISTVIDKLYLNEIISQIESSVEPVNIELWK